MKTKLILFFPLIFVFLGAQNSPVRSDDILFSSNGNDKKHAHILVKRVVSADTIILDNDEKIKLIGVNAPAPPRRKTQEFDEFGFEVPEKVELLTPVNEQAFEFVRDLLEEKWVRLEFDTKPRNEDFQKVAYVFLIKENLFVNAEILRQGFAELQIRPPNLKYADKLRAAYKEARQEKRGLQGN